MASLSIFISRLFVLTAFAVVGLLLVIFPPPGLMANAVSPWSFWGADKYVATIEARRLVLDVFASGRVKEVFVEDGQQVKKGEPIIEIDQTELSIQVRRAQADLDEATASLSLLNSGARNEDLLAAEARMKAAKARYDAVIEKARPEVIAQADSEIEELAASVSYYAQQLSRVEKLRQKNIESANALDLAKMNHSHYAARLDAAEKKKEMILNGASESEREAIKQDYLAAKREYETLHNGERDDSIAIAKAKVDQAKADLDKATWRLEQTTVRVPEDSVVETLLVDRGAVISEGTHVVSVLLKEGLYADIYVPSTKLGEIKLGSDAYATMPGGDELVLLGRISQIAAESEFTPQKGYARDQRERTLHKVRVNIEHSLGLLKPGMYLEDISIVAD